MRNLYEILEVSSTATPEVIRAAYRTLAKKLHPDGSKGEKEKFLALKEAHDILMDPEKRAMYDAQFPGANGNAQAQYRQAQQPPQGRPGQVWVNGIGWVDESGAHVLDRRRCRTGYRTLHLQLAGKSHLSREHVRECGHINPGTPYAARWWRANGCLDRSDNRGHNDVDRRPAASGERGRDPGASRRQCPGRLHTDMESTHKPGLPVHLLLELRRTAGLRNRRGGSGLGPGKGRMKALRTANETSAAEPLAFNQADMERLLRSGHQYFVAGAVCGGTFIDRLRASDVFEECLKHTSGEPLLICEHFNSLHPASPDKEEGDGWEGISVFCESCGALPAYGHIKFIRYRVPANETSEAEKLSPEVTK
jgi:curved DNA-binding protein CbpA